MVAVTNQYLTKRNLFATPTQLYHDCAKPILVLLFHVSFGWGLKNCSKTGVHSDILSAVFSGFGYTHCSQKKKVSVIVFPMKDLNKLTNSTYFQLIFKIIKFRNHVS